MENNPSIFSQLLHRRVLQIVGSYLIGGWAFIQFIDWVVSRYSLASGWTEFVILFLLICLPSVIMLSWYHGAPGPDQWRKLEKIFIPINVFVAAIVGFMAFPSESKAAQLQEVTATSVEGDTIVRQIPSLAFQERIAIFPAIVDELPEDKSWMSKALPMLSNLKMEQDMTFTSLSESLLIGEMQQYGFQVNSATPENIYRTIAEDQYTNHYVRSTISADGDQLKLTYSVRESKSGKEKTNGVVTGDIYGLVDGLHDAIRDAVLLKDFKAKEEYVNLGAESLISPNLDALESYVKGVEGLKANKGDAQALDLLIQSTKTDSTCAQCYAMVGKYGMSLKGMSFKKDQLTKAFKYYRALPERQQFMIRYLRHFPEEIPKADAVLDMWQKLYPMDATPVKMAMGFAAQTMQFDRALAFGEEALANGHSGKMLLDVAQIYTVSGQKEKANELLTQFAELYPQKAKTVSEIGYAYLFKGEHEKGIAFFQDKVLLNPENPDNYYELGLAYSMIGDADNAIKTHQNGLDNATQSQDSAKILQLLEMLYGNMGRIEKFIETFDTRKQVMSNFTAPMSVALSDMFPYVVEFHKHVGREKELRARLLEIPKKYNSAAYQFDCPLDINYFIGISNGDSLALAMNKCRDFLEQTDGKRILKLADGVAKLNQAKYPEAIALFEAYASESGLPIFQIATYYGKALMLNGDLEKALSIFDETLEVSAVNPMILSLKARTYEKKGQAKKAKEAATKALEYWKKADANYAPKKELEQFVASL